MVMMENQALVEPAFRTGKGVGWGSQSQCLFCATGRFFRPGYHNSLVGTWLPALDGMVAKLERGAVVADVGCGHGFSTVMMAKAFPNSTFVGYDFHPGSVEQARKHASEHGVAANTRFEVGLAGEFPGRDSGPRDLLRLPARHGRPGRRGTARAAGVEAGRALDGRGACGGVTASKTTSTPSAACIMRLRRWCACRPRWISRWVRHWERKPGLPSCRRSCAKGGSARFAKQR